MRTDRDPPELGEAVNGKQPPTGMRSRGGPSLDKPSAKMNRGPKVDQPVGEAFPDRDPTKKKTGEF